MLPRSPAAALGSSLGASDPAVLQAVQCLAVVDASSWAIVDRHTGLQVWNRFQVGECGCLSVPKPLQGARAAGHWRRQPAGGRQRWRDSGLGARQPGRLVPGGGAAATALDRAAHR